jgi:hypothetical protein
MKTYFAFKVNAFNIYYMWQHSYLQAKPYMQISTWGFEWPYIGNCYSSKNWNLKCHDLNLDAQPTLRMYKKYLSQNERSSMFWNVKDLLCNDLNVGLITKINAQKWENATLIEFNHVSQMWCAMKWIPNAFKWR